MHDRRANANDHWLITAEEFRAAVDAGDAPAGAVRLTPPLAAGCRPPGGVSRFRPEVRFLLRRRVQR